MNESILPTFNHHSDNRDGVARRKGFTGAIDTDVLFTRCMGNVSFALTLLGELEATGMEHVERIAQHSAAADCAEAAHALKGAAGIIGAETLRSLAAKIEAAGMAEDLDSIAPLIEELRREMERCLAQIPEIRQRTQ